MRLLRSAHDCSDGGLACTLAESALGDGEAPHGVSVELDDDVRPVATLFGEAQGRIVVSCDPTSTEEVLRIAAANDVPARKVGSVTAAADGFSVVVRAGSISSTLSEMSSAYFEALPAIMDAPPGSGA